MKSKLGSHSAVEDYWNDAHTHLQQRFCDPTLGSKIKIERSGAMKHMPGKNIDADYDGSNIDHVFDMGTYTKENIGSRDLMVYICYDEDPNDDNYVGEARISVVCLPNSRNYQ